MKILLADAFFSDLPKRLSRFGEVYTDMARLSEAEVLIVRSKTRVDAAMMDAAPALKFIIRGGVGVDTIDTDSALARGILVDNTPEASSVAVAELAFALMLALPNRICLADSSTREGRWLKKDLERSELFGKTLGLIGLGRIARELAVRAKAFGMRVLAYDLYVASSDLAELKGLEEVLAASDYLSLHTPLTDQTKGMINAERIGLMKKGARLINTCRGEVVVEEDVAAALASGRLAGYATDVYKKEPPESSPLFSAPNCLCTPHLGASTAENLLRLGDAIEKRLQAYCDKAQKE
ncbi:MAG: hydroxyacid dehydrogenase [Spirochaetia bacterium]|jgi:D-3-phosphoglycerate dehydrogenase|nr:hydroxyacid dehydrogenase [Spirochaetia bacterium]